MDPSVIRNLQADAGWSSDTTLSLILDNLSEPECERIAKALQLIAKQTQGINLVLVEDQVTP